MLRPLRAAALLLAACAPSPEVFLPEPRPSTIELSPPAPPAPSPPAAVVEPAPGAAASARAPAGDCFGTASRKAWAPVAARWAPTGSRLAITCAATVEVVDIPERAVVARRPGSFTAGPFRADGAALLLRDAKQSLLVWDLVAGTLTALTGLRPGTAPGQVSPDFRRVVQPDPAGAVVVIEPGSGAAPVTLAGATWPDDAVVSWSPDGATVALAATDLAFWDAATGRPGRRYRTPTGEQLRAESLQWTRDGATVYFGAWSVSAIQDGTRVRGFGPKTGVVRGPFTANDFGVAPDGQALYLSRPGEIARVVPAGGARRALYREDGEGYHYPFQAFGVSGDGRWVTATMAMMSGTYLAAFDARSGAPAPWW